MEFNLWISCIVLLIATHFHVLQKSTTYADELDNLMGISIEIDSNKRMKRDYIKSFKLTFKDKDLEKKVSHLLSLFN